MTSTTVERSVRPFVRWRGGIGGRRARRAIASVVVTVLVLAGCVGPSRTVADYEEKAANTAEAAGSTVETSRLVVSAAVEGKAPLRYTSLVLSEAEVDAGSIGEAFKAVQPPSRTVDGLRDDLVSVLDRCTTILAGLRIAAYRGDTARLAEVAADLPQLSSDLARFAGLRPT